MGILRRIAASVAFLIAAAMLFVMASDQSSLPLSSRLALPTFDARDVSAFCADLDSVWGKDWLRVIETLEMLRQREGRCNNDDPTLKLYPAYYNYGAWLEARGRVEDAIRAYQNALAVNPQGNEAAKALQKRSVFTPSPPPTCPDEQIRAARDAVPAYTALGKGAFVQAKDSRLVLGDQPFPVRGINYYPVRAPWRRFLSEADLTKVGQELDLIKGASFNTLRIFLYYEALFDCPGSGAVPKPEAFARLDGMFKLMAERGLRVLVTLNDMPDLTIRPLYLYPETAAAQTAYIVSRYKDEPLIFAWDIRNEGDMDYTQSGFSSSIILNWLKSTSATVRKIDPNHLITAGWLDSPSATDAAVDFWSFHHWSAQRSLRLRIASYRNMTKKPLLVEETGFSTFGGNVDRQRDDLQEVLEIAEAEKIAGWMVWTAFDFPTDVTCVPPACPSRENGEHYFGLWRKDYTPKPAVDLIKRLTAQGQ